MWVSGMSYSRDKSLKVLGCRVLGWNRWWKWERPLSSHCLYAAASVPCGNFGLPLIGVYFLQMCNLPAMGSASFHATSVSLYTRLFKCVARAVTLVWSRASSFQGSAPALSSAGFVYLSPCTSHSIAYRSKDARLYSCVGILNPLLLPVFGVFVRRSRVSPFPHKICE